jgi:hypothetical protein
MSVELKTTLEKLYEKYFLPGNYIIDFPENYQDKESFNFTEKYNSILDTCILESIQTIKLLDIPVEVIIHKPIKKVHRYEFEEYFGFGGHCEGFNSNKKIILCPKYKKIELDELLSKIDIDILNDNKIIELCLIMFLLGFWNKRQAINDLLNFLESEINPDTIFEYLFQKL